MLAVNQNYMRKRDRKLAEFVILKYFCNMSNYVKLQVYML